MTTPEPGARDWLLRLWDESWQTGTWFAPWTKATDDLTPEQALWRPSSRIHSIWQNVHHVCIWREYTLAKLGVQGGPGREDMDARNFELPLSPTPESWHVTLLRLKGTHVAVRQAVESGVALERFQYHLVHDAYHLGQIMTLRAMQGLPPIE